jgi:hypothetical protein
VRGGADASDAEVDVEAKSFVKDDQAEAKSQ